MEHTRNFLKYFSQVGKTLLKTLWPFFIDGIQLPQGYSAFLRTQFTFYDSVARNSWYSFDQPRKDERLSQPIITVIIFIIKIITRQY